MNLIEKIKNIPRIPSVLFLSASVLLGGCATTVQKKFEPTGNERIITTRSGYEKTQKKIFDISEPVLEGESYKIDVKESLKETNYETVNTSKEREFREIEVKKSASGMNILPPILLGFLGSYVGKSKNSAPNPEKTVDTGALIGFLVGAGLGGLIVAIHPITKKSEVKTGRTQKQTESLGTEKKILNESLIYNNRPAKNTNVLISHGSKKGYLKTSNDGYLYINWKTAEFFGVNWNSSEEILKKDMEYFNPLIKGIKPAAMKQIKPVLNEMISTKNLELLLETIGEPSSSLEEIENDSKRIVLRGYNLEDEAIYRAVKDFVNRKINPKIKTLEFSVNDITTHIPIDGSTFTIKTQVPSKSSLTEEFFSEKIKNYAENCIKDYLTGTTKVEDVDRIVRFDVYAPSEILVEVTHPDYKFVSGDIPIYDNMEKTVYMVDKGTKVRVEEESKQAGRIE